MKLRWHKLWRVAAKSIEVMGIPRRLIEYLDGHSATYEVIHHPIAFTAQELAAIEGVKGREHAKVVVIRHGRGLALIVLPSDRRVDWDKLRLLFGEEVALATEAEFGPVFPDCATGTMPPLGHLYGIETHIDQALTQNTTITFEAGTHADAIRMRYEVYAKLAQPKIGDLSGNSQ